MKLKGQTWINEWIIVDENSDKNPPWKLKENAPEDIKEQFEALLKRVSRKG